MIIAQTAVWFWALLGTVLFFLVFFISKSIYLVQQAQTIVIERLGKFEKVLMPGLNLVMPFVSSPRVVYWTYVVQGEGKNYYRVTERTSRIDLREAVYDFPKQNVITKDNVTMEINALLYYQITDVKAAVYEVANLPEAIEKLTQTTLRNVIGSLDLDESLVSRDQINEKLRIILDEATDKWGVKVNRVELQEVNPPADIRHAMEKQMRAERDRRAIILEAEGKKRASILTAEGERASDILQAEGEAQARVLTATSEAESRVLVAASEAEARLKNSEAEAKAIKMIQESLPKGDPQSYMVAMQYIKALPELTKGKNDKLVVIPYEAAAFSGALSSIKEIFKN
jgi:regulator of protease activity HflC (stomatin/prohibitin superfamily)